MDELTMARAQAMVIDNLLGFAVEKLWEVYDREIEQDNETNANDITSAVRTIGTARELAQAIEERKQAEQKRMEELSCIRE